MVADSVGRAALDAWQEALSGSGLPLAGLEAGGAGRARLAFGAPLPAAAHGSAELAEVWLLARLPLWAVREGLAGRLPTGHRWIGAEDVWLGAPALAGRVVASDWRIELEGMQADVRGILAGAVAAILTAPALPRIRVKGTTERRYDLRPLIASIELADGGHADAGPTVLRIRTRIDPEIGSGRPDEVVAALAEAAGHPLAIRTITRERLILAEDIAPVAARAGPSRGGAGSRFSPGARPRRR